MDIIAFDPGQTTGWRSVNYSHIDRRMVDHKWHGGILGPARHHLELYGLLDTWMPDVVIMEHFVPQSRNGMPVSVIELISRDYEGVIELWCLQHKVFLKKQNASEGKAIWSDQKITHCGLWKPSKHTRDATAHLLHYITTDLGDSRWLRAATIDYKGSET